MNQKQRNKIKQAMTEILKEYHILTGEDFDSMDGETGCELYENLKAGVLEKFDLDEDEMGDILDEILDAAPKA